MIIDFFQEREKGREGERKRERNIHLLPAIHTPTRDQTHNPGMCTDWGSNPKLFGAQDQALTNWTTGQGQYNFLLQNNSY